MGKVWSMSLQINSYWWNKKSGALYQVTGFTNLSSTRLDDYPYTICYKRIHDDTIWSRPLSFWHESYIENK